MNTTISTVIAATLTLACNSGLGISELNEARIDVQAFDSPPVGRIVSVRIRNYPPAGPYDRYPESGGRAPSEETCPTVNPWIHATVNGAAMKLEEQGYVKSWIGGHEYCEEPTFIAVDPPLGDLVFELSDSSGKIRAVLPDPFALPEATFVDPSDGHLRSGTEAVVHWPSLTLLTDPSDLDIFVSPARTAADQTLLWVPNSEKAVAGEDVRFRVPAVSQTTEGVILIGSLVGKIGLPFKECSGVSQCEPMSIYGANPLPVVVDPE